MADFFRKTEHGRREVRERTLALSRPARNLLLILDSSRRLGEWIDMIQGATLSDAAALVDAGLIEAQTGPGGPETRPLAFEPTEPMGHDTYWQSTTLARQPAAASQSVPGSPFRPAPPAPAPRPLAPGSAQPAGPRSGVAGTAGTPRTPLASDHPRINPSVVGAGEAEPRSLLPEEESLFVPLDSSGLPLGSTGLGYTELYDSLNALLRESLGLFRSYRYTLRIEKAQNVAELEAVARDFIAEVRRVRGDPMARMVQRALGLGG